MKILITGYKGFIAQNLGRHLTAHGHEVEGYDWIPNTLPAVDYYDQIIHLGAITDTTSTDVKAIMEQNVDFSTRLLGLCEAHGVNLMYASSASVYGTLNNFKEEGPYLPKNAYAWSKYLFDRIIQETGPENFGCRVQGLRLFNVYGEFEDHKQEQASIFYQFRWQAEKYGSIQPFQNSENYRRDFIYVADVCDIIRKLLHIDESNIWNIGTGIATPISDIAEHMSKKLEVPINYVPMPEHLKGQYQEFTKSDTTQLLKTIGSYTFSDWKLWLDKRWLK